MEKQVQRGTYEIAICHEYNLIAIQWKDSRIVNHLSSYLNLGVGQVRRRTGNQQISVPCPKAIIHYQENMGGVDRGDQMRAHFGGFASQGHFKKWYKKTLMAVLDCMLHNARLLWNMSVDSDYGRAQGRRHLERYEFMHVVAQERLKFKTESLVSPDRSQIGLREEGRESTVVGMEAGRVEGGQVQVQGGPASRVAVALQEAAPKPGIRCVVCQLEVSMVRTAIRKVEKKHNIEVAKEQKQRILNAASEGDRKQVSNCTCCPGGRDGVGVSAHSLPCKRKRIHKLFPDGMSCMEIVHSEVGHELWKRRRTEKTATTFSCTVARNHHYMDELRKIVEAETSEALGVE
jgi:hypothetical protein